MVGFRYSAVVAADIEELDETLVYSTKVPICIGQIELEYQPQLEYIIPISTALLKQWGGPESKELYLFFIVDGIVLCDRSTSSVPFNTPTLILRPARETSAALLKINLAAAKRTTR
jgi:hypothetical protein